ncbi:Carbohydrate binding domain-containing protein [Pustulibacterium marinum]|uniref:Carbohydrate binding domain-containing protein n=1 Tax=Pustulibacterium marinum TaxID=1224947 RepID=A0A1I7GFX9_9FLAO|nr:carbohydrate binding domain-containing protein [Pustulibacterium marinum]SFU47345.1 Carbohydrate binding domain-containing protein [Pustulibacterium marinum]
MKVILVTLASILFSMHLTAQKNILKNGSFEQDLQNWRGDATINPYNKKSGNNSCMINQFTDNKWKGIDQIIPIPKNTAAIEFTGWVKTDAVEQHNEAYKAGVITVELLTGGDKSISYHNIAQVVATTPWTAYKELIKIPENAKKARIILALAETNGSILFDNLSAKTFSLKKYNALLSKKEESTISNMNSFSNGSFEEGFTNWSGNTQIITTDDVKDGTKAAAISSKTATWTAIDQQATIPTNAKEIIVSGYLKSIEIMQGKENWNNGMFILELTTASNEKAREDQLIGSLTGSSNWTYFEKTFPIPTNASQYRIMIALSNCTGTLMADGITIEFKK